MGNQTYAQTPTIQKVIAPGKPHIHEKETKIKLFFKKEKSCVKYQCAKNLIPDLSLYVALVEYAFRL